MVALHREASLVPPALEMIPGDFRLPVGPGNSLLAGQGTTTTPAAPPGTGGGTGATPPAAPAGPPPPADGVSPDQRRAGIQNETRRSIYEDHRADLATATYDLRSREWASNRFVSTWEANRERYQRVSNATGVPAELIAALHFRESSGNFNTYLHNGQPLGRPTTLVPAGILFHDWESAAIHALNMKDGVRRDLQMTAQTDDVAAMATYAEYYNGLGYHNRGQESPYVYAGSSNYTSGKYVADGVYDANHVDSQLGVVAMIRMARGEIDTTGRAITTPRAPAPDPGQAWGGRTPPAPTVAGGGTTPQGGAGVQPAAGGAAVQPAAGGAAVQPAATVRELRRGARGPEVVELQRLLNSQGFELDTDADFGTLTANAVREFQASRGLSPDGIVGAQTWAALRTARHIAEGAIDLGTRFLARGNEGNLVRALQRALTAAGFSLRVDGDFGPSTDAAVRRFQASRGLEVDGVVGESTRQALYEALGQGRVSGPVAPGRTGGEGAAAGGGQGATAANGSQPADPTREAEGAEGTAAPGGDQAGGDTSQRLQQFFENFNGIPVRVNPNEPGEPRYVDVIPPYHINTGHRLRDASRARAGNAAVNALIQALPVRARVGKATTGDIRSFLEQAIAQGLVADTSALGLRDFLATYGISTDCSGFVSQALNYLADGNMTVDATDPFSPENTHSSALQGGRGQFDRVGAPNDLRAGDTMHIPGHIRIILSVRTQGEHVVIRTAESTPREDVVEQNQRDGAAARAADGGIGDIHWRYRAGGGFEGLERSSDGGQTWVRSGETPTWGRWRNMPVPQATQPQAGQPQQTTPQQATGGVLV